MKRSEIAVNKFKEGYNCAQAVSYSFCDDLGFDKDIVLRLSCGFGAGMARKEEVCGAVSGGIFVLGMKYGRGENQDRALMEDSYIKIRELMDRFTEEHGTYICRNLIGGCELTTEEGQKEYKEKDLRNKVCNMCISSVVDIVEDILKRR